MTAFKIDPGLTALVVSMSLACAFAACRRTTPSVRFPHALHLTHADCGRSPQSTCLECTSCHEPSRLGTGHPGPSQGLCASCHHDEPQRIPAVLAFEPVRTSGEIRFDHDQHLAMDTLRGQCFPCHSGVVAHDRPALPDMDQCLGCHHHAEQWRRVECTPCHSQRDLARTLPVSFLRHDASFARNHGSQAALQGQMCQTCHTQAQCQACHDLTQELTVEARRPERIEAELVHRGDFVVRHALEARSQPARCLSCHTAPSCDACHSARGVSASLLDPRNPHPPGWLGRDTRSSDFHGTAARRDILSCAGCHEAGPATNCIGCHRVGAYGGNPHPSGWRSSRADSAEMCRYCHE